ncbi:hypothetical protein ECE50_008015 [Chitinophaga sp. Mgbs1]|uniref:Uncharacterized protein n=1 Tax=Chitinophaga solisilvae TaxID=1233460 RepID=A0A433WDT8_9BACT|nr:hypothetical protein [Chitinophaga solisilvae]
MHKQPIAFIRLTGACIAGILLLSGCLRRWEPAPDIPANTCRLQRYFFTGDDVSGLGNTGYTRTYNSSGKLIRLSGLPGHSSNDTIDLRIAYGGNKTWLISQANTMDTLMKLTTGAGGRLLSYTADIHFSGGFTERAQYQYNSNGTVKQIFRQVQSSSVSYQDTIRFGYDSYQNVLYRQTSRYDIRYGYAYDYSKPATGSYYTYFTFPELITQTILEMAGLAPYQPHHAISSATAATSGYPLMNLSFGNFHIDSSHKLLSYNLEGHATSGYALQWNCQQTSPASK